jgi:hypothetical protein
MRPRGSQAQIEILELRRGRETLARLELIGQDMHANYPWMFANFFPTPAFETIRELFRELADDESRTKVREFLKQQQIGLCLPDFQPVREFTLIVEGGRAQFKFDEALRVILG